MKKRDDNIKKDKIREFARFLGLNDYNVVFEYKRELRKNKPSTVKNQEVVVQYRNWVNKTLGLDLTIKRTNNMLVYSKYSFIHIMKTEYDKSILSIALALKLDHSTAHHGFELASDFINIQQEEFLNIYKNVKETIDDFKIEDIIFMSDKSK
jgi:hypothetical protein